MVPVLYLYSILRRAFFLRVCEFSVSTIDSMEEVCWCLSVNQRAALLWIFSRAVTPLVVWES